LVDILCGYTAGVDWFYRRMPPGEVDCMLAALRLLHMWVKYVIPDELGGNYAPEVSASGVVMESEGLALTIVLCLPRCYGGVWMSC